MAVPPAMGPLVGVTDVSDSVPVTVKPFFNFPCCGSGFRTMTSQTPAGKAGVVALITVLLNTVTLAAGMLPKKTKAPCSNPVPEMVTTVPGSVVPDEGVILVIVGAGRKEKLPGK